MICRGASENGCSTQLAGHVAVVDDDEPMRVALSRLLSVLKIDCRTYASGRAFLAALPAAMPVCLLLDVNTPDMTGIQLQRQLVELRIHIPTIIITGVEDETLARSATSLGASAILHKPVTREALTTALYSAVKKGSAAGPGHGLLGW